MCEALRFYLMIVLSTSSNFSCFLLLQTVCSHDKRRYDDIDFDTFLNIMHQQISQENAAKEIHQAFRLSDTIKRGFIPAQELRHILIHTGERLSNREVDQMFRAANVQPNGYVKYDEFVRMVTLPLPEL